ncbi:MAG: ROK family transcriptional regulator [Chloroflexi bacterium]|nr:ROK family transcriptional regulator [Chloroflexota bacterium]
MTTQPRRGNRDLIKAMNRNLILNILRGHGPLSRSQLTELSGLSVGAVSQITSALITENWIKEDGEGDYTGGRRQTMLRLNPTAGHVIGIKLMEQRIVTVLTDLETTPLAYLERPLPSAQSPEVVIEGLRGVIDGILAASGVSRSRVVGVGIGLAGVIDYDRGIVHYSPYFHWRDVPLADILSTQIGLPVYIENDVNSLTLTEQLFGAGHEVANFVVVTVGRGIGMGMVFNHQRYQGTRGGAGELGHITVESNGLPCDCGKFGCLEAMAADPAVFRYVEQALAQGIASRVRPPITLQRVVDAAREGDELARSALSRSGRYLGMGLATVINILSPSLIVLSGEGVIAEDYRLQSTMEALHEHTFDGLLDNVRIVVKPADEELWARGAAGLVVGKVFESPLLTPLTQDA